MSSEEQKLIDDLNRDPTDESIRLAWSRKDDPLLEKVLCNKTLKDDKKRRFFEVGPLVETKDGETKNPDGMHRECVYPPWDRMLREEFERFKKDRIARWCINARYTLAQFSGTDESKIGSILSITQVKIKKEKTQIGDLFVAVLNRYRKKKYTMHDAFPDLLKDDHPTGTRKPFGFEKWNKVSYDEKRIELIREEAMKAILENKMDYEWIQKNRCVIDAMKEILEEHHGAKEPDTFGLTQTSYIEDGERSKCPFYLLCNLQPKEFSVVRIIEKGPESEWKYRHIEKSDVDQAARIIVEHRGTSAWEKICQNATGDKKKRNSLSKQVFFRGFREYFKSYEGEIDDDLPLLRRILVNENKEVTKEAFLGFYVLCCADGSPDDLKRELGKRMRLFVDFMKTQSERMDKKMFTAISEEYAKSLLQKSISSSQSDTASSRQVVWLLRLSLSQPGQMIMSLSERPDGQRGFCNIPLDAKYYGECFAFSYNGDLVDEVVDAPCASSLLLSLMESLDKLRGYSFVPCDQEILEKSLLPEEE